MPARSAAWCSSPAEDDVLKHVRWSERTPRSLLVLALSGAVMALAACGSGSVSLENAAGADWPHLSAGAKTSLAKSCIQHQAAERRLPQRVRDAVRTSDPQALVARLNLYYRDARPNSDPVAHACKIAIEQRYAPVVRITRLLPGRTMPADNQFLRVEGTVTNGAGVHLRGGERVMPAFVVGRHFKGTIEVEPGRHRIYAAASFPGRKVNSRPILVTRKGAGGAG